MGAVAEKSPHTPEDLLAMPDGKDYELVDGNLVERDVGALSSLVGGTLHRLIGNHVAAGDLGWVWPADSGFQCFPFAPGLVRRPDVSFIRRERLRADEIPAGHLRIAPDLVVEVLSPNDLAYDVDRKVEEYRRAGVPLIWVVNPDTRTVAVLRADGTVGRLGEGDDLSGEGVIPGLRLAVRDLFPAPTPTAGGPSPVA